MNVGSWAGGQFGRQAGIIISFPEHNSETVRNILMIIVFFSIELVSVECPIQKWQLCLSSFSSCVHWSISARAYQLQHAKKLPYDIWVFCNIFLSLFQWETTFASLETEALPKLGFLLKELIPIEKESKNEKCMWQSCIPWKCAHLHYTIMGLSIGTP